jgi:hypothetical protein
MKKKVLKLKLRRYALRISTNSDVEITVTTNGISISSVESISLEVK